MCKKLFWLLVIVALGLYIYASSQTPLLDREWSKDQTVPAEVIFNGDIVTIKNVRNFSYKSTADYTPGYYDTTVNLKDLTGVDYIVEPFGDIGAAHTFLSFGFEDGQQIAISIEIRKEIGESFSPWLGVLNQYELMYVIADERDVVDLRANHRLHDVYLYPTTANREKAKMLFISMLQRANKLQTEPEFYNTLRSNCTTNIASHINEITPNRISFDWRLILPEKSDELAKELGLIAPGLSIEEARAKYRINDKAKEFEGQEDFSILIRQGREEAVELVPEGKEYLVSRVIDGDTIEVENGFERQLVRYIGIDTPETAGPNTTPECLGEEASNLNRSLVEGKLVSLVSDTSDVDKYGRWLRYVYVDGIFVNKSLVEAGMAEAKDYYPDTKYSDVLKETEGKAKSAQIGIWSAVCQPV